jgi:hypothetical protein
VENIDIRLVSYLVGESNKKVVEHEDLKRVEGSSKNWCGSKNRPSSFAVY